MTCRRVQAAEAHLLGFTSRVVDPDELDDTSATVAAQLAARPRFAMQVTKRHFAAIATTLTVDSGCADAFVHGFGWGRPDVRRHIEEFVAERVPNATTEEPT